MMGASDGAERECDRQSIVAKITVCGERYDEFLNDFSGFKRKISETDEVVWRVDPIGLQRRMLQLLSGSEQRGRLGEITHARQTDGGAWARCWECIKAAALSKAVIVSGTIPAICRKPWINPG